MPTKEICGTCNRQKDMYYVPWCPVCEKPQRETKEVLNLIKATRHIQAITNDNGTKEKYNLDDYHGRMWNWFIKMELVPKNDSFVLFWRPEGLDDRLIEDDEQNLFGFNEQEQKDVKLFCDTFNIDDHGILLDISW